jgi:predicted TIM-barrel fold metal-dependent hydrolase
MAAGFSHFSKLARDPGKTEPVLEQDNAHINTTSAAAVLRGNVYIDTMHFHPGLIRASVDLLGAGHVLAGSDFPIVSDGPIRARLETALTAAGLSDAEQGAIAAGNALRLMGVGAAP